MAETGTLAASLVAALTDLTVVTTDKTANAGSYSYNYADLADLVKLTRPVLARHGLVALTPVHAHDDALACTVIILHESGERLDCGPFPFPEGNTAQATGSMVTYHRRYSLLAALGMATEDDDDASSATAAPSQPRAARKAAGPPVCAICGEPAKEGVRKHGDGYVHVACVEQNQPKPGEEPF